MRDFSINTMTPSVRGLSNDMNKLNGITLIKTGRIVHIRIPSFQILNNNLIDNTYTVFEAIPEGLEPEYPFHEVIYNGYVKGTHCPLRLSITGNVIKLINDNGNFVAPFGVMPDRDINVSYITKS